MFMQKYETCEGCSNIIMTSDGEYLRGLFFEDSRDVEKHTKDLEERNLPIFEETKKWLDIYFSRKRSRLYT